MKPKTTPTQQETPDSGGSAITPEELIQHAIEVRHNAYAPYSNFLVGAAVLTEDGKVFTGSNVENASYGLTCCAERIAIFNMVANGYMNMKAIAVVTEPGANACGACRQVIREFATPDMPIYLGKVDGTFRTTTIEELLPGSFGPDKLKTRHN